MEWVTFFLSYPLWVRLTIFVLFAAIFALFVVFKPEEAKQPPSSTDFPHQSGAAPVLPPSPPTMAQPAAINAPADPAPPSALPRQSEPVEWQFGNGVEIFGQNFADDGSLLVGTFNILGKNNTDEPITNVDAYLMPQLSTSKLQLFFVERGKFYPDTKAMYIEPRAQFQLSYIFHDNHNRQGITIEKYLQSYGAVELVFKYDNGKQLNHAFAFSEIKSFLLAERARIDAQRRPPPGLRPLSGK